MSKGNFGIDDYATYFLYKRGQSEHIEALYEKGEIFINTIDCIRTYDENSDRSDPHDSIHKRKYLGDIKVTMCDIGKDVDKDGISFNALKGVLSFDSPQKGHIYCLSGVFGEHLLGDRSGLIFNTTTFGESLIVINRPQVFLDRIKMALEELGMANVQYGRVKYYHHEHSGLLGVFKKHERFKYQNEFRIFVPNTGKKALKFNIGPLHDIASLNKGSYYVTYPDEKIQKIQFF